MDLLDRTQALVEISSPSRQESEIVAAIEQELRAHAHLEVVRLGDNLVARTNFGCAQRVILAGHTDTVPASESMVINRQGDRLFGVGSADMKGGLAVMLQLAAEMTAPAVDITYVFYAREEIASSESGLGELFAQAPELLHGDIAILGEPTDAIIEAGCQGTMRFVLTLKGARAHTARPWMGRNAIHRMGEAVQILASTPTREPIIDGCHFREALQAVAIEGGIAGNVVPDVSRLTFNFRFAPDRSLEQAEAFVRSLFTDVLEENDTLEIVDAADAAAPGLTHPLLSQLVSLSGGVVEAKLGWTDVARFAAHGIPAVNFGPGDNTIAHTAGEYLDRQPLEKVHAVLRSLVQNGV